jgi:hypothetical protein
MPYKHREPVPESEMNRTRWHGHYTICQKLRDLYHALDEVEINREEAKLEIRIMMAMAKAMNSRLQHYVHKYEEKLNMPEFEED